MSPAKAWLTSIFHWLKSAVKFQNGQDELQWIAFREFRLLCEHETLLLWNETAPRLTPVQISCYYRVWHASEEFPPSAVALCDLRWKVRRWISNIRLSSELIGDLRDIFSTGTGAGLRWVFVGNALKSSTAPSGVFCDLWLIESLYDTYWLVQTGISANSIAMWYVMVLAGCSSSSINSR